MKNYNSDTQVSRRNFLGYLAGALAATTGLSSCVTSYPTIDEVPPIILNDVEPDYGKPTSLSSTEKLDSISNTNQTLEQKTKENYQSPKKLRIKGQDTLELSEPPTNKPRRPIQLKHEFETIEDKLESESVPEDGLNQELELKYKFNQTEYERPGDIPVGEESDVLMLAKTVFCEGREYYRLESKPNKPNPLELITDSVQQRALRKGRTIKQTITHPKHYSFLNNGLKGHKKFVNPIYDADEHPAEREAWQKCYMTALERLNNGPLPDSLGVTHFHDESVKPTWSYGEKPRYVAKGPLKKMFFYFLPQELS